MTTEAEQHPPFGMGNEEPSSSRKRKCELVHTDGMPTSEAPASLVSDAAENSSSDDGESYGSASEDAPPSPPAQRKRKISALSPDKLKANPIATQSTTKASTKKPQMKYDPDVPMTKEEAAVWRREQRRKRNRESAAASRQRQRNRIAELEDEVQDYKTKFEAILRQVRALEKSTGAAPCPTLQAFIDDASTLPKAPEITLPCPSTPSQTQAVSTVASQKGKSNDDNTRPKNTRQEEHSSNSISSSRPAVKIMDAVPPVSSSFPVVASSSSEDFLLPVPCVSERTKLEPMDQALLEEAAGAVLCVPPSSPQDDEAEPQDDFVVGEFLLDGVDWL